ncbi:N-6 DNA methylase [Nocardia grenadensis]|uniref:N-6 DNA methylase n=1 Tax=Embleya sp. NPDC005971 TaxID=3156724 RepID=UPI0034014C24
MTDRNKTLFANAKSAENAVGETERGRLILGDWSPFHARSLKPTTFDPDEIQYVAGVAKGKILAVYAVAPDENGNAWQRIPEPDRPEKWRVRFHGVRTLRHLEGTPSPVTWGRGQGTPVRVAESGLLTEGDAAKEPVESSDRPAQRAVLGHVTVTADTQGHHVTVDAPAGTTLTIRTTPTRASIDTEQIPTITAAPTGKPPGPYSGYYTPRRLVEETVKVMLDSLGEAALQGELHIGDPATGSGNFLIEAMRQLARRQEQKHPVPEGHQDAPGSTAARDLLPQEDIEAITRHIHDTLLEASRP